VADAIAAYQGPDPYVDALLWQTTSRIAQVEAEHSPRRAGASSYTFGKSVKVWSRLAFSGSDPIGSVAICLGLATTLLGVLLAAGTACRRLLSPVAGSDGMLALLTTLVLGGVQVSLQGVLAEYLRRNHRIVSQRPQSVIRQVLTTGARSGEQDARGAA
jgi:undecaprenyl-phosphate 4-deoxy-4-formamido-L-arabinose transferase